MSAASQEPENKGRRGFLKTIAVAAAWLKPTVSHYVAGGIGAGMWAATESVLKVHSRLAPELDTDPLALQAAQNWDLINDILGPFSRPVVSPANDNPALRGVRHDNDWRAASTLAAAMRTHLGQAEVLISDDVKQVMQDFGSRDKMLSGGAISHPLARLVGYSGSGYNLNWTGKFPQRWVFWYNRDDLTDQLPVKVYHSSSTELTDEPLWEIRDIWKNKVAALPGVTRDRLGRRVLGSNWLLITKYREREEFRPLTLSAGCNGVGTASLAYVLADRSKLEELRNAVKGSGQWQALYRIQRVEYDDGKYLIHPVAEQIKLEAVQPLDIDPIHVEWPDPRELLIEPNQPPPVRLA